MEQGRRQWRTPVSAVRTEQVLERYYGQLVQWGTLLTRGDEAKAQDLVHDFCLHFTITKPDLSGITNLDGYLYKSLRNIYLSSLAQSSREALQLVNIAEFDSIQLAFLPRHAGDSLQRQNDLRKICSYAIWRKAQTKSASYFVLRYFHGYHHREIADLAGTNLAAIYSKFRRFRIEVLSFLEGPGKLQFTNREAPPTPALQWTVLSSADLFKELRKTILDAQTEPCLPAEELLALYGSEKRRPISCSLLSHIVSCERCLALIDNRFQRPTLKDREPLDEAGDISEDAGTEPAKPAKVSREKLLRSVRKYKTEILEHRPTTLSIAVDGKIVASHDVQAQRSVLSARVERPENAGFVEVFSDQGIRLVHITISELPPEGPHGQSQRVYLSDNRWLDLSLSFDGLGLSSEVVYFDPALAPDLQEDDGDEVVKVLSPQSSRPKERASDWLSQFLRPMTPSPVLAWSLAIAGLFCVSGYLVVRNQKTAPPLNSREVLNHAIRVETANLEGQTEHQVFRFEQLSADGAILKQGSVDLWKDGDSTRHMRRLYDAQHRLIAAEWQQRNGENGDYLSEESSQSPNADLLAGNFWRQDLSPDAFRAWNSENTQIRATQDGYELTSIEAAASHPRLLSTTLVLDRQYHPIREVMRIRSGDVREVRFVEADYERRPSYSVPDTIFDPQDQGLRTRAENHAIFPKGIAGNTQLAELHIAVLYQLNSLEGGASDPIEVQRTADGYIHVTGMVANDDRKQDIASRLSLLHDHQLLKTELVSPDDLRKRGKGKHLPLTEAISVYDVGQTRAPADVALQAYFAKQGLTGKPLDAAVSGFSREALWHAQRVLQNASALKRLSNTFSAAELDAVDIASQQQWTELVATHASALEVELRALHDHLSRLTANTGQSASAGSADAAIETSAQFARAADQLFVSAKNLDQQVSNAFASGQSTESQPADIPSLIAATASPLQKAVEMTSFAVQLNSAGKTAASHRQHSRPETQTRNQP
jgi:DNA-directed RNA polymerase specialized sigma24 family protein